MTEIVINDSDRRIQYTASGGQTVFPYDFPIFAGAHLVVTRLRAGVLTTRALTTDYTVSGVGVEAGGNVTLVSGSTAGDVITIYGNTPVERTTDFNDAGDFFAATLNREFDLQTQMIQQNERDITRSLRLQDGDTSTASLLPLAAARASKFLAFDSNGDPIAAAGTSADLGPVSTYIDALLDDTTLAAALASLLFSADMQVFLVAANDAAARSALDVPSNAEAILDALLTATGDMIYASGASTPARLPVGSASQVLVGGATPSWAGVPSATQAQMEAASSTVVAVTPGVEHFHPGMPKCIVYLSNLTGTPTVNTLFNSLGSLSASRSGTGDHTFTWTTSLGIVIPQITNESNSASNARFSSVRPGGTGATSIRILTEDAGATLTDVSLIFITIYGDLA